MDAKAEAKHRREIADALDVIAEKFQLLDAHTAEGYRGNAQVNRSIAEKLDPPQPEWQDGDLVRDRFGNLWQFDGRKWHSRSRQRSTMSLMPIGGPIRKVHVADPAKHEVVVSLDGLDREDLDLFANQPVYPYGNAQRTVIRVALAAREQLGEVQ